MEARIGAYFANKVNVLIRGTYRVNVTGQVNRDCFFLQVNAVMYSQNTSKHQAKNTQTLGLAEKRRVLYQNSPLLANNFSNNV